MNETDLIYCILCDSEVNDQIGFDTLLCETCREGLKYGFMVRAPLYENRTCSVQVLPRVMAEEFVGNKPYTMISITDTSKIPAKLQDDENRKFLIRCVFYDVVDGKYAMRQQDVDSVVDVVNKSLKNGIYKFVIHCERGISRSSGVAAAISKYINGESDLLFKYYAPNTDVYIKVLMALSESDILK